MDEDGKRALVRDRTKPYERPAIHRASSRTAPLRKAAGLLAITSALSI